MDRIRAALPVILEAVGIAIGLLLLAVAALSTDNPLIAIAFLIGAIAVCALFIGFGQLLALVQESTTRTRQIQGDARAFSNAVLEILQNGQN